LDKHATILIFWLSVLSISGSINLHPLLIRPREGMVMLTDGERYSLFRGDCIPHMLETMQPASIDSCVTSVPFPQIFSYTDFDADLGNSEDMDGDMKIHFGFFFKGLARVLRPGRIAVVHCMQIPKLGRRGDMFDFRGFLIRLGRRAGLLYDNDWLIWRNPQSEAVRTHAHGLLFVTLERDRASSRAGMGEYLIKFRAKGENAVPIDSPGISREEWIDWASPCWHGIKNTVTLNKQEARGPEDCRHICPFAIDTVTRLVRLYSNPGEIVFDPFAGLATVGYEAIRLGRRFHGTEIKAEYHAAALRNLARAARSVDERPRSLLDVIEEKEEEMVGA
jgi:hypothetical protein